MDVERTMQFILEKQARFSSDMLIFDERTSATGRNLDRVVTVVTETAGVMSQLAEAQRKTEIRLQDLAQAQQHTDKRLNAPIDFVDGRLNGPKQ